MCLYVATVCTLNLHKDVNKYIHKGSFFLSIHTATPSLEDYEQAYIVHTGSAG